MISFCPSYWERLCKTPSPKEYRHMKDPECLSILYKLIYSSKVKGIWPQTSRTTPTSRDFKRWKWLPFYRREPLTAGKGKTSGCITWVVRGPHLWDELLRVLCRTKCDVLNPVLIGSGSPGPTLALALALAHILLTSQIFLPWVVDKGLVFSFHKGNYRST